MVCVTCARDREREKDLTHVKLREQAGQAIRDRVGVTSNVP